MLHLWTLGTLDLRASAGHAADDLLAQPRSMALLLYLLLSRPRGYCRRDTLCVLFWPDADGAHARGALSQALRRIRRSAAHDILELRGKEELRVVPGAVRCDVLAFEEAIAHGRHAEALELYGGPFLPGFHAAHMPGFERWAEAERDRLRSLAGEVARSLAREEIAAGRLPEGAHAAARALALVPESEAVAGELLRALADAGDRAGALHLYDAWCTTLAAELELEPSGEAHAIAAELRAGGTSVEVPPLTRTLIDSRPEGNPGETLAAEAPAGTRVLARRWLTRRKSAAGVMALGLLLLGGWGLVRAALLPADRALEASGSAPSRPSAHEWLLLSDFEGPSADPGLALAFQTVLIRELASAGYACVVGGAGSFSRRGLEDMLARMRLPATTRLDANVACDIAAREGAAGVVAGRVLALGRDYVLTAIVLDRQCRELIRVSAIAQFDELTRAVTAVSRELRARLGHSRASIRTSPLSLR